MIEGFADDTTEDIFHGTESRDARRIPRELWTVARRKLDMLNVAHDLRDLRAPPGNRLEALRGRLAGLWSIRVNDQYRLVFHFSGGIASKVQITDYH